MGEVLAVYDTSTNRNLALKRLLPGAKPRHVMLLQREYHTLIGLSHPNVVQAFEYDANSGAPFYTMDLLRGSDVESLAPLPWNQVTRIMRDVAGALALMHARGVVHRDVTARNVWLTEQGTVKLIDFGALSSFGEARDVTGTPPFVAPEVLRTCMLDQRTDLYSLGALGYFLLTGRHAYPARRLLDLEHHWSRDLRSVRELVAELNRGELPAVPEPLDELIESLLETEPSARPDTAGDVIDRLAVLLPDMQSGRPAAVRGALDSKAFVGRAAELNRLCALLKQATSGLGISVAVLAAQGNGRSRLLAEFAVAARVAGATVVTVRADGDREALSAAARCALKLLESLPVRARKAAASRASVLGHVSSNVREQLGLTADELEAFPETPGEARVRVQAALSSWWLEVATDYPVVVLLDDLQDMDEPSAALFAALSHKLEGTGLLLIATVRHDPGQVLPRAAQAFVDRAAQIELKPLDERECGAVLRSMFGDVEHLARAAQRLALAAEGNAARVVELAEYLVRSDSARYVEGSWVLPQDIGQLTLPDTRDALDEARLSALSAGARALALRLSVVEGIFSLEVCQQLTQISHASLFAALGELLSAGVLTGSEDSYRFRREQLRILLLQATPAEERRHACALLGDILLRGKEATLLCRAQAGVQLLRGGELRRGFEVINEAAFAVVENMAEEHADVARYMELALPLLRPHYSRDQELMSVLCALAVCGFFVEQKLGVLYGDEALERAGRALGVQRTRQLRPFLGPKLGMYVSLLWASLVFWRLRQKQPGIPKFAAALHMMFAAAASLAGMYAACIERKRALHAARAIEPMSALGPDHVASIVCDFSMGCVKTVQDKLGQTAEHWRKLLARLDDPHPITGCDANSRLYYRCGALYAFGVTECLRDNSSALAIAAELERQPLTLFRLSAEQLRALYHGHQGNSQLAAHHKAQVEIHALQRGITWQLEVWSPSSAIAVADRQQDAMAAKRATEQLRHISAEVPSLLSHVHAGNAVYLLLRERFVEAIAASKDARASCDHDLVGATSGLAQLAQAYNGAGKFEPAHTICTRALARLTPADLRYSAMMLRCQIELSRAEAGLGNHVLAGEQLDQLLKDHEPGNGPLTMGALHEARAQVARQAGEVELAAEHLAKMQGWYRGTGCPTLKQHCDRVRKASRDRKPRSHAIESSAPLGELLAQMIRASLALDGAVFASRSNELICVAHGAGTLLSDELIAWAQSRVQAGLSYVTRTEDSDDHPVDLNQLELDDTRWNLWLLVDDEKYTVLGAVLLANAIRSFSPDLLRTAGACLIGARSEIASFAQVSDRD